MISEGGIDWIAVKSTCLIMNLYLLIKRLILLMNALEYETFIESHLNLVLIFLQEYNKHDSLH